MSNLLTALRPIMSIAMRGTTAALPDETPVTLTANPNRGTGYTRNLTMGELREMWTAYEEETAAHPLPLKQAGNPLPTLRLTKLELHEEAHGITIRPGMYKLIVRFKNETQHYAIAVTLAEHQPLTQIAEIFQTLSTALLTPDPA